MILLLRSFSRSRFDFPIKHENKNTARIMDFLFYLSPDPLLRVLSNLRASNVPTPPGRGRRGRLSDLRGAGGGLVCSPIPWSVPLSRFRSFAITIRSAGRRGDCDVRRFCQLVFLRYPLANDGEAAAGRPVGGRRSGCVICRMRWR